VGFRTGIIRDWQARWYADKQYGEFLQEDLKLRQAIQSRYTEAGVSLVEVDRQAHEVSVTIHTARPGVVIGRGGQRVDEMRLYLETLIGKKVRLNIQEIRQAELDAYLVARAIAEQIERRISYRRVMKQAMFRTMQAGAKGIRVSCAGRLGGAEIARRQTMHQGQVPLHTIRGDVDYGLTEARTTLGRIGVKVWIYKGEILPEPKVAEVEEKPEAAEVEEKAPEAAEVEEKAPVAAEVEEKVPEAAEAEVKVPEAAEVEEKAPVAAEVEEKPPVAAEAERKPRRAAKVKEKPTKAAKTGEKPSKARAKEKPSVVAEVKEKLPVAAEVEEKPPVAVEAERKPRRVAKVKEKPTKAAKTGEKPSKARAKEKPSKAVDSSSSEGEPSASAETEESDATT